jgi:hypothetical protein
MIYEHTITKHAVVVRIPDCIKLYTDAAYALHCPSFYEPVVFRSAVVERVALQSTCGRLYAYQKDDENNSIVTLYKT